MKSFIVAALLVAAVAGQSMDMVLKLNKEKALLNKFDRPLVSDLLYKQKLTYPWEKTTWTYGDNTELIQDELFDNKVYHLEEIMEHPLWREYMTLPLFRQFWQYTTFQKYVTSVYFQRFWQIPTFKQYFYNPVLFYKYIFPIVQLFKTDITYPTTYNNYYGDERIMNKNLFPVVTGFERDLLKDKYYVPTIYNQELKLKDELLLKHLIVKIYSHLYNIPEELVVKHFLTTDKLFNPITEEYKTWEPTTYKTWEPTTFKTWEKTFEPTIYGDKLNEEVLLKKYLINKMIKGDETFKTWEPTTFKTWEPTVFGDKLNKDVLLKKYLINKMIKDETFKTPEEIILREKMMKMNPFVHRMLLNKKFDTEEKMFDIPMKKEFFKNEMTKELIKDEMTKNLIKEEMKKDLIKDELKKEMFLKERINEKFNDFETYETPKIVDITTPMMGVKTFDKKVFPETIIKV